MDRFFGNCDQPDRDCFRSVSCSTRLSRDRFGALAAPGAFEASALPLAPFRFWLPPAGPPRKAASGLGSRAHSLPGARHRRAEQEKRVYLNRITLIGFLGSDAKKTPATQQTSQCSRSPPRRPRRMTPEHRNRDGVASMRHLRKGGRLHWHPLQRWARGDRRRNPQPSRTPPLNSCASRR